jgi:hypothetical protein
MRIASPTFKLYFNRDVFNVVYVLTNPASVVQTNGMLPVQSPTVQRYGIVSTRLHENLAAMGGGLGGFGVSVAAPNRISPSRNTMNMNAYMGMISSTRRSADQ